MKTIFSVYQDGRELELNVRNHQAVKKHLETEGFDFVETSGAYKGSIEKGFMVETPKYDTVINLFLLAKEWDQESILIITDASTCFLKHCETGRFERIGQWTEVSPEETDEIDAYTSVYDQDSDSFKYFVAK